MAWRDRPYAQPEGGPYGRGGAFSAYKPTPVVGRIMLVCLGAFVVTAVLGIHRDLQNPLYRWAALLFDSTFAPAWQVWRWITYQYLHGGVLHFAVNMLFLYFFGPPLERAWGPRQFFVFYTASGVVAALAFALMDPFLGPGWLIGASGCVLGCVAAAGLLWPHMVIWIYGLFPIPLGLFAILTAGFYALMILAYQTPADFAHLGGMAAGVVWVYAGRRWPGWQLRVRPRVRAGAWEKKLRERERDEQRVDRILDKIRRHGMASLTWWERRALRQASERLRQFDEQHVRR